MAGVQAWERGSSVVSRRVDLACGVLGFEPPPFRLHLRFVPMAEDWLLTVRTLPGRPASLEPWLQVHEPDGVAVAPGLAPKVVRARFEVLPEYWWRWLSPARVHHVDLAPDGVASVFVDGEPEEVERFLEVVRAGPVPVYDRPSLAGGGQVELTPRQLEALSSAVALGYYEIPHRIDLRGLAQKIGITVGSISALLRRAEAGILMGYVDSVARSRWDPPEAGLPLRAGESWRQSVRGPMPAAPDQDSDEPENIAQRERRRPPRPLADLSH